MASPAPRRTHRHATPRQTPPRRTRLARTTPARARSALDDTPSASAMDVDEHPHPRDPDRALFAKSDQLAVAAYATLPRELSLSLRSPDFYADSYSGEIDVATGLALVVSQNTCFVWQYTHPLRGAPPTCYIFACPPGPSAPLHALVPAREPGLILLAPTGQLRFWVAIGIGLAGGDHFFSTSLDLLQNEYVSTLVRANPQTYIASTSTGRLFRLTITSAAGRHTLTPRLFAPARASPLSLARFIPGLWSAPPVPAPDPGNIAALALDDARTDLWALCDTRVQRWSLTDEDILLDDDVSAAVSAALGVPVLDLELLDLKVESTLTLVVLVSHAGPDDLDAFDAEFGGAHHPRRIYALVRLSAEDVQNVIGVTSVPYQSTSTSGPPTHPRLVLLASGAVVAVQFGDAVALCARDSPYADRLALRAAGAHADRTLGLAVDPEREGTLLVLTAGTMMRATLDLERVAEFDDVTGRANLIKSIMTQAILYGSNPENPLHFCFPPEVDGESLMAGAEQLSRAVLESDPEIVRPNHDLTSQLTGRKDRLSWLVRFINDNAALGKMSQRSRQRLATDAEKLYACHQLWLKLNEHLDNGATHSLLADAVHAYMAAQGDTAHDDVVRAFFKYRAADVGRLLGYVVGAVEGAGGVGGEGMNGGGGGTGLVEANASVLTVLQSAFDYRAYNLGVYGVDLPMIKPWTSRPTVIDVVLKLVDASAGVAEGGVGAGANGAREAREQLPALATVLFACVSERLDWLGSAIAADEAGNEGDRRELEDRFAQLRPEVLEALRVTGHLSHAFTLAESYRDFRSLAALCHKDTTYPPHANPHARRIEGYVERFREEFTTEVYRWCVEHGELRVLFAQEDTHAAYMDKFFAEHPHPAISWIHDLGRGRQGAASVALLGESKHAAEIDVKHFMLSIGKLSQLAQLQESGSVDEGVLEAFHDDLDFVSVQEKLLEEMKKVLVSVRGRQGLDGQVEAIAKAKAGKLRATEGLLGVFKTLVRQVLQGKTLSVEDAVDLLTLKDNEESVEDYATALHLLARAEDLPDVRRASSFRRTWCRIYNHDDWDDIRQTANVTDSQLNARFRSTALYATLAAILPDPHQPEGYDLDPSQALPVEALGRDCRAESTAVEQLRLEDVYHRVRELAVQDLAYEGAQ
ncbi:hypothetical protein BV22DRAFT_1095926 [Leucogyrophana mollusca]|uniref:Uncharacterized protein n=1 Tax=Leucogyrophana mollusca TaxID=85980 RepID=A0ACB8B831_9AGAM|nr:hypothetical protein BV22DRAFT_1095926 [Leucogyrophana mollusca]